MTKIYSERKYSNHRVFECEVKEYDACLCVIECVIEEDEPMDIHFVAYRFCNPYVHMRDFLSVLQHYLTGAYTLNELNEPDLF